MPERLYFVGIHTESLGTVHGPKTTIARTWYRLSTRRRLAGNEWRGDYWYEGDGTRIVPCRRCPKLDARREECRVPFGSPLRKCVVAATEAHLRDTRGLRVLEIGFARRSYPKQVVRACGGSWTGIEPLIDPARAPRIGRGCHGHAGDIPFADATFDVVCGNQSLEHWEEPLPRGETPPSYRDCLTEIWRVLKPGGRLYLDAPIHLHGHEMFVAGDIERILGLFVPKLWRDVITERWRYEHAPLPRYPAPATDVRHASAGIKTYDAEAVRERQNGTVWLLTVTAHKRETAA